MKLQEINIFPNHMKGCECTWGPENLAALSNKDVDKREPFFIGSGSVQGFIVKISMEVLQKTVETTSFIRQICNIPRHIIEVSNQCLLQHVPQLSCRNDPQNRGQ